MTRTILFAGGGTGGHIYPNLAIAERLSEAKPASLQAHFLVSDRAIDAQVLSKTDVPFTPLPARPLTLHPLRVPAFIQGWFKSIDAVTKLIAQLQPAAMVATGGFVSGPAVVAANRAGVPVFLVNLDAVPGRANRMLASRAVERFTVYESRDLPGAKRIGLPLRRSAVGPVDKGQARAKLGLDPDKETILVTAGSQGAQTVNRMMIQMVSMTQPRRELSQGWQVLHLSGQADVEACKKAYDQAGIPNQVAAFCHHMGLAWRSASIAISRAGAGSVAEAWANAAPTIFLPYPFHKDQHQKLNAAPLVQMGSAMLFDDLIDGDKNARRVHAPLMALMKNESRRQHMAELLMKHRPEDGAAAVAKAITRIVPTT